MKRYAAVLLTLTLLALAVPQRQSCANMPSGAVSRGAREVVACYFGALRKDGNIMVNLVPGGAGAVYPVVSNLPVTLNGAPVGVRYLQGGMPIVLFLNSRNVVDQVQVRPAAGGR